MYGGVAQTYCLWKRDGEPFKENKVLYVYVIHPLTKCKKKVRFYTDKKHADLAPKEENKYGPVYKIFGFKSETDNIIAIREKDLTKEEIEEYFGYKWRCGIFFGTIWYAPAGSTLPPIKKSDKFFYPTWGEFHKERQRLAAQNGFKLNDEAPWNRI